MIAERGRVARLAGNILVAVLAMGLVLGVGEIVFRLPPVVRLTGGNGPGMKRWAAEHYDRVWDRNPQALRSFHVGEPKRPGTFRILTLGDSFTWGYFIARTEDTWPYVLERLLRDSGQDVEVINIGLPALSTVEERRRLDKVGWQFDPDLVLLQYTLNDPVPASYWTYFKMYPLVPGFNYFLDQHSYLFSFLNARFRSLQMGLRYPRGEAALYEEGMPGWEATKSAIRGMAQDASGRGSAFAAVVFPLFHTDLDDHAYPFLEAHRKVVDVFGSAGIPSLDLRQNYVSLNPRGRDWWALPCDSHPNEEGHDVAGKAIAVWLADSGLLSRHSASPL